MGDRASRNDETYIIGFQPCPTQGHRCRRRPHFRITVSSHMIRLAGIAVFGVANVIEREDGMSCFYPHAFQDPLIRCANIEFLQETVINHRLRMKMPHSV